MNNNVQITVVVPCYNSEEHLERCLKSILNQDYHEYEVVAYNNESTDATKEILDKFQEKYPERLKVIDIPNLYENSYREAFDHAFNNTTGEYITFIASDDYISTDYLSTISKIISPRRDTIKCFQSGISIMLDNFKQADQIYEYGNIKEFKNLCMQRSPVNTPAVIYHRDLYKYLKPLAHINNKKELRGAEDYDMFCNLADNNIFIFPYPKVIGYFYQLHNNQCTWKVHNEKQNFDYDIMIQDYWGTKWQG
jgi:glycosyltransferase involved in cell wall biosynthesis